MSGLDRATAATFARLTLGHVGQAYPYKADHVFAGPADVTSHIDRHPAFHGSFDWHSCVHGWWQLLQIARAFPDLPEAAEIAARADRVLTPANIAAELAFVERPESAGFERPYGWAWLLALHGEAARHPSGWATALRPLAEAFAARFHLYLARLTYPIRTGTHPNTAFALILAHGWAASRDEGLATLIEKRAVDWFAGDRACQAWEPSGDDFLSPALTEALLMATVLPRGDFAAWFDAFLPDAPVGRPATLFSPAHVSDRSDGKIAHLDGLNLSRAWCWRRIAEVLPRDHPVQRRAHDAAAQHLAASLPHLADDYMGTHWLASFALLALLAG